MVRVHCLTVDTSDASLGYPPHVNWCVQEGGMDLLLNYVVFSIIIFFYFFFISLWEDPGVTARRPAFR